MIPPAFVFLSVLLLTSVLCEVCDLACRNSGECKFGSADYSFESDTFDDDQLPFAEHIDGKYCKCISGWTGVQCEIKFVTCGENKHTCFNGAPCQADASGLFHCECDAAKSDLSSVYAGQFCEHVATVFCTTNDPTTGQPAKHSFCTNGGRCKEFVNYDVAHQGCDCGETFEGSHCQFYKKSSEVSANTGQAAVALIGITVGTIFLAVASAFLYRKLKGNQMNKSTRLSLRAFDDACQDSIRGLDGDADALTTPTATFEGEMT